jgi:hypothetical protein
MHRMSGHHVSSILGRPSRPLIGDLDRYCQMKALALLLLLFGFSALVVPTQAQERPVQKAFKGIELYSWQDSKGDWLFALLPGTNRLKSETEVKRKENQISGAEELEKHFMRLAEGELVFWFHRYLKGFAYPDEKMMKQIACSAKKAKVNLHVPPKGEKNG